MKKIVFLSFFTLIIVLSGCGKSELELGKEAFAQKDYLEAIKKLSLANELDKENFDQHETLALAFLYRGEILYKKTKNVKVFYGNVDKAEAFIPENPSENFKTEYSRLMVALGKAYQKAKSKSDNEKKKFFDEAISSFRTALEFDSTNSEAIASLEQLHLENFQKLLDKAQQLYNKALKTGNTELYYTSESYVNQAAQFDEKNKDVRTLISKIRQRTLGILDFKQGLALAVNKHLYEEKHMIISLAIRNYKKRSIRIKVEDFELIDIKGNVYQVDMKEMEGRKIFGDFIIEDTLLTPQNSYMDGLIVFTVPEKVYMRQISYKLAENEIIRKYFR